MIIATWNVNSIKSRQAHVIDWLKANSPDVLLLQELKSIDFPSKPFEALGYRVEAVTQKTYNGVATLSRYEMEIHARTLAGDDSDKQSRFLETTINGIRLLNIYLPNGNPTGTEKFAYKLAWMDRLKKHMADLRKKKIPTIVAGDFNVIPEDIDCFSTKYWKDNALFQPEPRDRFRELLKLGYFDAFRKFDKGPDNYTFWEYFLDHWKHDRGIRIDHFLISNDLKTRVTGCMIDKRPRALLKPSDHTPIVVALK